VCICVMAGNGIYGTLRLGVGTIHAICSCHEIPEVRRLARTTSADAWRDALGMPTIPNTAAAASRLLCQIDVDSHCCSPSVHV